MPNTRSREEALAASVTDDVILAMGPRAPRLRIAHEVARRCAGSGLALPMGRSLTARIARHAWKAEGEPGRGVRLVVDQGRLHQTVEFGKDAMHPLITLAFLDPLGIIVAHRVDPPSVFPAVPAARLLVGIKETMHAPPIVTRMPATVAGGWADLRSIAESAGIDVAGASTLAGRAGVDIRLVLGRSVGGLRIGLRPRSMSRPGLDPSILEAMLEDAVTSHNKRRKGARPPFTLSRSTADDLERSLDAFIARH